MRVNCRHAVGKKMDKLIDATQPGSSVVNINVYGTPGMDVNELAAAVERRIIQTQKRRTTAWSTI